MKAYIRLTTPNVRVEEERLTREPPYHKFPGSKPQHGLPRAAQPPSSTSFSPMARRS